MKIKLDKPTIETLGTVANFGMGVNYDVPLVNTFVRSALQSLILKLCKGKLATRKAFTLQITPAEALAFYYTLEVHRELCPGKIEYLISQQYFIQPLEKELADGKR